MLYLEAPVGVGYSNSTTDGRRIPYNDEVVSPKNLYWRPRMIGTILLEGFRLSTLLNRTHVSIHSDTLPKLLLKNYPQYFSELPRRPYNA